MKHLALILLTASLSFPAFVPYPCFRAPYLTGHGGCLRLDIECIKRHQEQDTPVIQFSPERLRNAIAEMLHHEG